MNYKRDRIIIGNKENREEYLADVPWCECCGKVFPLEVHHHIRQQQRIGSERYTIDLPCNYSTLCRICHGIIENSERQYNRELLGDKTDKPFSYWQALKDNINVHDLIEEHTCK